MFGTILEGKSFHLIARHISGLSQPFWGMGPGPLELGKIALFLLKLGKNTLFYALSFYVRLI